MSHLLQIKKDERQLQRTMTNPKKQKKHKEVENMPSDSTVETQQPNALQDNVHTKMQLDFEKQTKELQQKIIEQEEIISQLTVAKLQNTNQHLENDTKISQLEDVKLQLQAENRQLQLEVTAMKVKLQTEQKKSQTELDNFNNKIKDMEQNATESIAAAKKKLTREFANRIHEKTIQAKEAEDKQRTSEITLNETLKQLQEMKTDQQRQISEAIKYEKDSGDRKYSSLKAQNVNTENDLKTCKDDLRNTKQKLEKVKKYFKVNEKFIDQL